MGLGHDSLDDQAGTCGPGSRRHTDPPVPLDRVIDAEGQEVYVECFPCPHAGQPIHQATQADKPQRADPEVGPLANPKLFEIAKLLMESGGSGQFRNRYLQLKRVRASNQCQVNGTYHRI